MEFAPHNLAFIEALYARFLEDPTSVDEQWKRLFEPIAREDGHLPLGPSFRPRSIFDPAPQNGREAAAPALARPARALAAIEPQARAAIEQRVPFLRSLAIFQGLPDDELVEAAKIAAEVTVADGQVFVREGAMGQDLFVITRGTVLIRRAGRLIAELTRGEVVGEMAVLDSLPRSADAIAHGEVELLRIDGRDLLALLERRPALARGIIAVLVKRLRDSSTRQDRVDQLIRAYRVRGHLIAQVDPLGLPKDVYTELNPAYYGFGQADLDMLFSVTTIPGKNVMPLRDIIAHLRKTYCRSIGVQFYHIDDLEKKNWLQNRMESTQNTISLSQEQQIRILTKLTDAEIFEQFIHRKFIGAKRFSLEGAESLIPLLDMAVEKAGEHGVDEVVIGMAHRGRLNVLANVMNKSPRQIFREFDDGNPDLYLGKGDVKYHLGFSSDRVTASGQKVHLSLAFNPSHLEFVNPVVLGRVRAKQDRFGDRERDRGLGILIHGDAAFAGQGVVQETLNMSKLAGYGTGGTLHIVVNNQIGFTTLSEESRSTHYATDVAKMLQIPIFHVNGEHPEAVAQAIQLATEFREEFKSDVVIDMYCYRRYGHNEGDEPAFTQPLLYKTIRKRKSVRDGYLDNLLGADDCAITREQADQIAVERRQKLEEELGMARAKTEQTMDLMSGQGIWRPYRGGRDADSPEVPTEVPKQRLVELIRAMTVVPSGFNLHPKIERLFEERRKMASGEVPLDWAAAEALAFATLLTEGTRVRLSGQDSGRGTFSHRHAVLHDYENGKTHAPLAHLSLDQGPFEVFNSPLNETGVLGFEYGYSLDYPDALVIWEAQFGDFTNVAQVIIDQFITSGEDKWRRLSGLTLFLPHGFEGQGPEHSSARLERFLVACADDNIQVVNLTTPAQLFHVLRRQVVRPLRKPLVVMSPKSLLRNPRCVSSLDELAQGEFQRIMGDVDPRVDPARVRRVLLTSGKIFHELAAAREERGAFDVAILRVEQYYPLDRARLDSLLSGYPRAVPVVWVQEEPRNFGAWCFLRMRLGEKIGEHPLSAVARPESASPATGSAASHKKEQAALIGEAFGAEGVSEGR
jgi:2-oxoglutarate dehydrogenase E1 component